MTAVFVQMKADDLVYRLNLDCVAHVVQDLTTDLVTIKMRDGRVFILETEQARPLLFVLDAHSKRLNREIEEAESEEWER